MRAKKIIKPKVLENTIPSFDWMNRPDYKKENRAWIRKSINIALKVLDVLEEKNMTQSQLADKLSVSRQQISKILKGQENLTLETISKIESALDIKLGEALDRDYPYSKSVDKIKDPKANVRKSA